MFWTFLRFACAWWLVFASCAYPLWSTEANSNEPRYRASRWTTETGMPQNTVRCLVQTRDGYLWIGTRAGLARFDGVRMTIFNRANTPAMMSDDCITLTEDAENNLWIGTEDGLLCWRQHRFISYRPGAGGLSHRRIRSLCPARSGGLWIGTENGLDRYERGSFRQYTIADGLQSNNIRAVHEDRDGAVWVGTEIHQYAGSIQRMNETGRFESLPNNGTNTSFMVNCITGDSAGGVWWGNNEGLHCLEASRVLDFGFDSGLTARVVKWIHAGMDGGLLVVAGDRQDATGRRGLLQFRNGEFFRLDLSGHGVEDDVICALQDREGSLWAGTRTDGLIRLQPMQIGAYTVNEGLSHSTALTVCQAEDDTIYVGTRKGLNWIRGGEAIPLQPDNDKVGLTNDYVIRSVFPAKGGGIWEGRLEPGGAMCTRVDKERWLSPLGFTAEPVSVGPFCSDRSGSLWIAHARGVFCLTPADGTGGMTQPPSCPTNDVRAMLEDRAGNLWFGTFNDGVTRWRDGRAVTFTTRDGLSSNRAWALLEDSGGVLWVGTDRGLNRLTNGHIAALTLQHGLFDDRIHCILEDDSGYFWLSGPRGIYRVPRRDLLDVADGKMSTVRCVPFGEADGMPSSETSGGYQPAGWKARDGRLWFPTLKGVMVIEPSQIHDLKALPPVVIEQIAADGEVVFGDGMLHEGLGQDGKLPLRAGRARTLEIRYTANTFVAPERVRFRYQLDGHDPAWREVKSNERLVVYTNLRPGDYTFRVTACNHHGYWNESGATVAISLAPLFTQTVWFPVTCALGLIAVSATLAGWRLRWQRRISRSEQRRALANERARIARDLHDDLGTALTGVALDVELTRRVGVAELESRLSGTAAELRALVQRMREVVWAVNPDCDDVGSLATFLEEQARTMLEAGGLEVRIRFPERIPETILNFETRHQLSLGLREAFTNILRHAEASKVEISMELHAALLVLEVRDNGRGLDLEALSDRRGHGLEHLRVRMSRLGGLFEIRSRPKEGTTVIFRVPLQRTEKEQEGL